MKFFLHRHLEAEIFNQRSTSPHRLHQKKSSDAPAKLLENITQPAITCSKLTIETLEQSGKYAQS